MQTPDTEGQPSQPISASHNQHASTPERPSKRPRLTLACNECRKRKVKCDAEIPKCRNCRVRGIVCETTDPKHPELVVVRKYGIQYQEDGGYDRDASSQGQVEHMSPPRTSISVLEHEHEYQGPQNAPPQNSWIARSYRAQQALDSASLAENESSYPIHDFSGQQSQPDSNESPEMAINSDGTAHKQKLMGGSSLQSLTMFLDLYLQRAGKRRIGPCFRHGMSFAEDYVASLVLEIPDLPPPSLMDTYFEAFVRGIHPLYPVLDLDQFSADIKRIRSYQDASWTPSGGFAGLRPFLKAHDIPILACIYAVISLGADEAAGTGTEAGRSFLSAAHGLYAHLVGQPHLSSVQALTLIMLALRGRGTEGQGFQVLGTAIRIAHSIGLHRHMELATRKPGQQSPRSSQKQAELHVRIWWTIYALEKLMELDTTRPSGIPHGQHDQFLPSKLLSIESQSELKYFIHWIALARILEQICELLYRRKRGPESTLQILQCIGTIDSALRTWKNNLPEDIQPDAEIYCKPSERPFALFLALQYHHTLITLHRASLILPHNQFLEDVQSHAASLPHDARLRNGEALCTASARKIISLFAQMENRLQTPRQTLTQLLHGCIVLALGIMRNPQSRTVRSDLELSVLGTELTEAEFTRLGQDPNFTEACAILRGGLSSFVQQLSKRPRDSIQDPRALIPEAQVSSHASQLAAVDVDPSWNSLMPSTIGSENDMNFDFTSIFEGTGLEDLWMVGADVDMYSPLVAYQ